MIRAGDELRNNRARNMTEDTNSVQRNVEMELVRLEKKAVTVSDNFSLRENQTPVVRILHCYLVPLKHSTAITSMRP